MTVRVLLAAGYGEEAEAFVSWLLHSTRLTRPELRVLYDVFGRNPSREQTLEHLRGYAGSKPVRIGNLAADQTQLDPYGEVIDAVTQLVRGGWSLDRETEEMLRDFGRYVCDHWQAPDHGIWEPRGRPVQHTHSQAMCWVALDRLCELHTHGALRKLPIQRVMLERARILEHIETHCWNAQLNSYTQVPGGDTVDTSLLLLGRYGVVDAAGPRLRSTFETIRARLAVSSSLFYRNEESRLEGEGAFGISSFWAVEHLARTPETIDEAEQCFSSLVARANEVGLFSEEIDPATGALLGNFPQAFTHVGLVGAAQLLDEQRAVSRSEKPARRGTAA